MQYKIFYFENPVWKGCRVITVQIWDLIKTWWNNLRQIWDLKMSGKMSGMKSAKCEEKVLFLAQTKKNTEYLSRILPQNCSLASKKSQMAAGGWSWWMSGKKSQLNQINLDQDSNFSTDIIPDTIHCSASGCFNKDIMWYWAFDWIVTWR